MHNHSVTGGHTEDQHTHVERHHHAGVDLGKEEADRPKIVLVGNPNVGKSLFFNHLSGLYVDVSNYPGTTVEVSKAHVGHVDFFDTPGVYGISSFTDDERVTREIVLQADTILNVVDAVHLERDLFLTLQLIDMGKKVSILLNFMDETKKQGLEIDATLLSTYLGVPVFETVAIEKRGFEQLPQAIEEARTGEQDSQLHQKLHEMLAIAGSEAEALLILEGDDVVAERHGVSPGSLRETLYIERRNRVNVIINAVLSVSEPSRRLSNTIGRWAVNTWTGIPILLGVLYLIYLFVGTLVAQDVVDVFVTKFGNELWEPWIQGVVGSWVPQESWLSVILVGEFGLLTMTITYLLFLLLPLVFAFYLTLAALEDSGYLPRLATLVDKSLGAVGLNGSAVIPLILGFGCVTMATITTRMLGSDRERRIAVSLLQFAIPCSAQLAVIAAMLAGAGFGAMLVYATTILIVFALTGTILNRFLPGTSSPLLLDLPPMRMPRVDNVLRKTVYRSYYFMREATPWFFAGALAVGIFQVTGLLVVWQDILSPLTVQWLQLPQEAATAFVMGMVRRDFGAAGLYEMSLSTGQILVALVTITLFVPCIASFMVLLKERGWKEAFVVWGATWVGAFTVGGILSRVLL